ncbi:MAG: WGR domain-containing protein [Chloroflexota bacterium]|nr:WGR domain-containing protein [Chloroflexota bacterium]MDP9472284.1 WGR domain-containing protein [Chloroflexota bacterium]
MERAHDGRRRLLPASTELGPVVRFHAFVRLISVDPAANRFRVYVLSWHPPLWGDFALVQMWGRLGRPGRSRTTGYPSRTEAQGLIVRLLRRRLQHGYRVVTWT